MAATSYDPYQIRQLTGLDNGGRIGGAKSPAPTSAKAYTPDVQSAIDNYHAGMAAYNNRDQQKQQGLAKIDALSAQGDQYKKDSSVLGNFTSGIADLGKGIAGGLKDHAVAAIHQSPIQSGKDIVNALSSSEQLANKGIQGIVKGIPQTAYLDTNNQIFNNEQDLNNKIRSQIATTKDPVHKANLEKLVNTPAHRLDTGELANLITPAQMLAATGGVMFDVATLGIGSTAAKVAIKAGAAEVLRVATEQGVEMTAKQATRQAAKDLALKVATETSGQKTAKIAGAGAVYGADQSVQAGQTNPGDIATGALVGAGTGLALHGAGVVAGKLISGVGDKAAGKVEAPPVDSVPTEHSPAANTPVEGSVYAQNDHVAPVVAKEGVPSSKPAIFEPELPRNLDFAKPRYNYGDKIFTPQFESPIDKAAYISAQKNLSKNDAAYVAFVSDHTGMSEAEVRAHGQVVKDYIKSQAKSAEPGDIKVPSMRALGHDVTIPGENNSGIKALPEEKTPPAQAPTSGSKTVPNKFDIHAANSPALSDEARGSIKLGTHEKGSQADLRTEAEGLLKSNIDELHNRVITGRGGRAEAATAVLLEHYSKLGEEARAKGDGVAAENAHKMVANIAELHSKNSSLESGRAVSANKLLSSTPEGQVVRATREMNKRAAEVAPNTKIERVSKDIKGKVEKAKSSVEKVAELEKIKSKVKNNPEAVKVVDEKISKVKGSKTLTESDYRDLAKKALKVPELTAKQSEDVHTMAKAIEDAPEGIPKQKAQQKIDKFIGGLAKSSISDRAFALFRTGLLTGLRTPGKVLTSLGAQNAAEFAGKVPGAIADIGTSIVTGKRASGANVRGIVSGFTRGVRDAVDNFIHDFNRPGSGGASFGKSVNFGDGVLGKVAQTYVDTIGRLHGSLYKPFFGSSHLNALFDMATNEAKNQGLKGAERESFIQNFVKEATDFSIKNPKQVRYGDTSIPEGAAGRANYEAAYNTNQNKTMLGNMLSGAMRGGGNAARTQFPFTQIPSSIATKLIDYIPVLGQMKEIGSQWKANGGIPHSFDQRAFSQSIGRGAVGTALGGVGVWLMKNHMMTGGFPKDKETQDQWAAEGKQEYSFLGTDNKWHQLASLGPVGNAIAVGGGLQAGLEGTGKKPGDYLLALEGALATGGSVIANSPYLQGTNNINQALSDPKVYASKFINGVVKSIVPVGIQNIAKATDGTQRKETTIIDSLKGAIPWLREHTPAKVDAFGSPIPRDNGLFSALFDPTYSSKETSDPFTKKIGDLNNSGYNVTPTAVTTITLNKKAITLDKVQKSDLVSIEGPLIKKAYQEVMKTDGFNKAGPDVQKNLLEAAAKSVRAKTNRVIKNSGDINTGISNLKKWISSLK